MRYTLVLLLIFTFSFVKAQRPGMMEDFEIRYDSMEQVKAELKLSDEQFAKWKEVNDRYYPQLAQIEKLDSLENRQRMMRVRKIQKDRDAELKEFIFAAQWEKYEMMQRTAQRERMKSRRQEMIDKRKQRMEEMKEEEPDGGQ
ncbi:MAG: hypothetical protein RLN88_03175 [Ekhidna sp.]|uniref:hypothetical protein n=1 Tax=Ekhidna sp. TaxID=2608089 RepID=UPI0032ED5ED1